MANLQFLRGSQTKLNNLTASQIKDGAFYLTEDTHRLYVGQSTGANTAELIDLNKYILDVDSVADLPSKTAVQEGDFYYCIKENVLARYQQTGTNTYGWVQINPDTSIQNVSLNSIDSQVKNTVSSIIGISETRTHESDSENPAGGTDDFGIRQTFVGQNISVRTDKPAVGGKEAELKKDSANGTITFIGDTYDLSTVKVDHAVDAYNTSVDLSFNRNIEINDKGEQEIVTETVRFVGDNGISLTSKDKSNGVSEITIRGTSIDKLSNKIIEDIHGIEIAVHDSRLGDDSKTETAFVPTISYGQKTDETSRSTTAQVRKGTGYTDTRPAYDFELNVYTIDEIDNILDVHTRTADAMRYIKAIDSLEELPDGSDKEPVQIGDTYKMKNSTPIIDTDPDTGSVIRVIKSGDLFIATGENIENENGNIDPSKKDGKILWDWVPAGNDTYKGYTVKEVSGSGENAITHMNLTLANGEYDQEKVAVIGVRATDKLHVEHSTVNEGQDSLIYTVKHDTQSVPDANSSKEEIDQTTLTNGVRDNNGELQLTLPVLVTDSDGAVKCDDYGHITEFETKIINLTHNHLDEVSTRAENPNKTGGTEKDLKRAITYVKTKMEDKDDVDETYFELNTAHTNIEFTAATNETTKTSSTTINLVWGSF